MKNETYQKFKFINADDIKRGDQIIDHIGDGRPVTVDDVRLDGGKLRISWKERSALFFHHHFVMVAGRHDGAFNFTG